MRLLTIQRSNLRAARYRRMGGASLALLLGACTNLPDIAEDQCGNAIVEEGEDCDTFSTFEGARCRDPGEENACRWDCSAEDASCPPGFGCGADGLCRVASGQFELASVTETEETNFLAVRDFDADGVDDVLGVNPSSAFVHYHGSSGELVKSANLGRAVSVPASGHLTDDAFVDVALVLDEDFGFVGVREGSANRTLSPLSYASVQNDDFIGAVLLPLDGIASDIRDEIGRPRDEILILADEDLYRLDEFDSPTWLQQMSFDVSSLMKPVTGARMMGDGDYACQQLALAYCGATWLSLHSPCMQTEEGVRWNLDTAMEMPAVALPDGLLTASPAYFAFVNDDGWIDLVVGAHDEAEFDDCICDECDMEPMLETQVLVGYGRGDGNFHSQPDLAEEESPDNRLAPIGAAQGASLLAVGHVNGDDRLDVVTSEGIFYGSDEARLVRVFPDRGEPPRWVRAAIADFNGNGLPDIAAGSDDVLKLDFFNGTGAQRLNHFHVPTPGDLDNFAIGDFDGDLLQDIAFVRGIDDASESAGLDSIEVMFGAPAGPPEPAVSVATLPEIVQLASGNVAGGFDSLSDLVALTVDADDGDEDALEGRNLARFVGTTDRQIQSPLVFEDVFPFQVAIGDLDGNGHDDLIALVEAGEDEGDDDYEKRLLYLPTSGRANISLDDGELSDLLPDDLDPNLTRIQAADLDGDGQDEIVLLGRVWGSSEQGLILTASFEGGRWRVGDPWYTELALAFAPYALYPDEVGWEDRPPDFAKLELVDVDDDGDLDLTVFAFGSEREGHVITLFPGNGSGFDFDEAVRFEIEDEVRSFTYVNADDDAAPELALYTWDGIVVGEIDLGSGELSRTRVLDDVLLDVYVAWLESGDVNGDGVEDIVLGSDETVEVYLGAVEQ